MNWGLRIIRGLKMVQHNNNFIGVEVVIMKLWGWNNWGRWLDKLTTPQDFSLCFGTNSLTYFLMKKNSKEWGWNNSGGVAKSFKNQ